MIEQQSRECRIPVPSAQIGLDTTHPNSGVWPPKPSDRSRPSHSHLHHDRSANGRFRSHRSRRRYVAGSHPRTAYRQGQRMIGVTSQLRRIDFLVRECSPNQIRITLEKSFQQIDRARDATPSPACRAASTLARDDFKAAMLSLRISAVGLQDQRNRREPVAFARPPIPPPARVAAPAPRRSAFRTVPSQYPE